MAAVANTSRRLGPRQATPPRAAATESWPPNVALARSAVAPFGASVVQAADRGALPFRDGAFDLVVSRHPTTTLWDEIARVLRPGGAYLSQQVGPGTNYELSSFFVGPFEPNPDRRPERAAERAAAAGLDVVDVRRATLRVTFGDVGAVVYFLRKVLWTVPDFTVERYRDRLRELHERIAREGPFVSHAQRFLIEARKPD